MNKEKINIIKDRVLLILGIILCVVLVPTLCCNITLIVKTTLLNEENPNIFGYIPMVITSGSMDDGTDNGLKIGDMIVVKKIDARTLDTGDVITYSNGEERITHRIVRIDKKNEQTLYYTKGDSKYNGEDKEPVVQEDIIGEYRFRVKQMGRWIMLLQRPEGLFIVLLMITVFYMVFNVLRKKYYGRIRGCTTEELAEELGHLRTIAEQSAPDNMNCEAGKSDAV